MIVDLQGGDRWEVIDELVEHLVSSGKIQPAHRDPIIAAIRKRELSMSTGIGFGIGIPHASTNLVSEVIEDRGRSKNGINFDALDGTLVYKVVLFLVPAGQFQKHTHILADIAKRIHKSDFWS
jgi:mannitol/fructose-specific phosphotransferase system IIA component (Ntr-type)